jgi:hypothetical protein
MGPTFQRVDVIHAGIAHQLMRIALPDEVISCTERHPFWVVGAGWTEAASVVAGTQLLTMDGRTVAVLSVERADLCEPAQVFNVTVSGRHTYYVGHSAVLVHNKPR